MVFATSNVYKNGFWLVHRRQVEETSKQGKDVSFLQLQTSTKGGFGRGTDAKLKRCPMRCSDEFGETALTFTFCSTCRVERQESWTATYSMCERHRHSTKDLFPIRWVGGEATTVDGTAEETLDPNT